MKKLTFLTLLMALGGMLSAQSSWIGQDASNKNYISTGMPIMLMPILLTGTTPNSPSSMAPQVPTPPILLGCAN